jgi:hypothetical protein
MMDPNTGLRKAREITKAIKYDNTVAEIIAEIQQLAEKTRGLDKGILKYCINDVRDAAATLESAIYKLEEAWEEAEYQERCREEEEEWG